MKFNNPTRDLRWTIQFEVKPDHVACAIGGAPCDCAAANALGELLGIGGAVAVGIDITRMQMEGDSFETRAKNSPELTAAIREFDTTGVFPPGVYRLLPPVGSRALGKKKANPAKGTPKNRTSPRKRRPSTRHITATRVPQYVLRQHGEGDAALVPVAA